MHGSDALNEIARRLAHDLGTRFPGIEVRFDERAEAMTCQVSDGGSCWGTVGAWVDPGDDLADAEFEELLVSIAEDIADNLWPDELTDPWPPCPQQRPSSPPRSRSRQGRVGVPTRRSCRALSRFEVWRPDEPPVHLFATDRGAAAGGEAWLHVLED